MPRTLRFGRFEVSPEERLLRIDGEPAALGGRAFDLLLALIELRERVASKDELLDRVWPGLVVEESNIQVQVSGLRKLLGPQAIATVPGRGYRFRLPVEAEPQPAPVLPPPATSRPLAATPAPPLIGRELALADLLACLDRHALVTVAGPGGIGKTALAKAAAAARANAWADGVAWAELAPLADPRLVPGAVAQALGLVLPGQAEPLAALAAAARPLALLLVLDNAEHLIDGVAELARRLRHAAPGLRLLVTSQQPLHLEEEQCLRLEGLAVPPPEAPLAEAAGSGAVALFTARAQAADRRFALTETNLPGVLEICRRLDGLPLALELAAARVPLLGVRGVATRLDERFKLLASQQRDAPTRQQTLQAALGWSLGLLPPAERVLFEQLAVFVGGFTLELACEVLAGVGLDEWGLIERLAELVDRSLVLCDTSEPPRYALTETARAHVLATSTQGREAAEALRAGHARALRRWFASATADWLNKSDADWLARYEPELGNLRAALAWAEANDALTLIALVGSAAPLWHHLSLHAEARGWHALSQPLLGAETPPDLAAAWWRAAQWAWADVEPAAARAAAEQAQALYRALGDVHGLYAQLTGAAGLWPVPHPAADAALAEALALEQAGWPPRERAWGQRARADVARANGRLAESRAARQAELALRIAAGDERGRLRVMAHLADLALALGEGAEAVRLGQALVAELRRRRAPSTLCMALINLLHALVAEDEVAPALALARETCTLAQDFGLFWLAADDLALLLALQGRPESAARLIGWADAAYQTRAETRQPTRAAARARATRVLAEAGLEADASGRLGAPGAALSEAELRGLFER